MKQGWIWKSEKYGVWFLPRQTVIDDWKQDHKSAYNEDREPENDEVRIWLDEQTGWCEVANNGVQIKEPDMNYWKKLFLEQMKRDTNWADSITEVK